MAPDTTKALKDAAKKGKKRMLPDVKFRSDFGKALLLLFLIYTGASGCSSRRSEKGTLNVLLDQTPATLNPRATLDAAGQRINVLLFRALTRIDAALAAQPDLASSWEAKDQGKVWIFHVQEGQKDHEGQPIDAQTVFQCLENYRVSKPPAAIRNALSTWIGTSINSGAIVVQLSKPDPYLPRNFSLLRYFRVENSDTPCSEPTPDSRVIGSGAYRAAQWVLNPEKQLLLERVDPGAQDRASRIRFHFTQDDNIKALKLIRGEVDVIQNSLSFTKTRWIERKYSEQFRVIGNEGVSVSYLAFNLRDPILSKLAVRQAIALTIDRASIVRDKMMGFGSVAGGLLASSLPESVPTQFGYDPSKAERILDEAGFPKKTDGIRLRFKYKTTPIREGAETALMFQDMLRKIGIELEIQVVEPAVFLASIRKGAFQLFSSRWVGVSDGSILYNTLRTGHPLNRGGYSDPGMDSLLDQAVAEPDLKKRLPILQRVQKKMAEDLPYFPLWHWKNAVILRKELQGLDASELSLSGGLEPLTRLR